MPRKKNPHSRAYIKPDYHSQNKKQTSECEEEILMFKKKIKLRSSLDIYNRLIHDQTLNINLQNVFIGYTDHVLGDQEMCVLDWLMIDSGGDIPMHHILCFVLYLTQTNNKKYKNKIIIWDRKMKLDRLYCSGLTNKQYESLQYVLQYNNNKIINKLKKLNNDKDEMDSFIDYNKATIAFDIDGTIVDIENRLYMTRNDNNNNKATAIMSGENYKYDEIIPVALAYLKYIEKTNKYNIIYLSGRRYENIKHSMNWLFNIATYPKGYIIHKQKRTQILKYKQQQLNKLNNKLNIIAYFGDTIIDCIAAINANIRPILTVANEWVFVKHIYGGIESVINSNNIHIKTSHINIIKRSPFWAMSYIDLIPIRFATELFSKKDGHLLPPSIISKCKTDTNYFDNILAETQEILESESKNEEKQIVRRDIVKPKEIFVDNEIINKLFPRYPTTDDGFVESFEVNETQKWMKYLDKYGLVVLKVLTHKQANQTINAMVDELYDRTLELQQSKKHNYNHKAYKIDINNPFTWNSFNFPSPFGKFLTDRPTFAKQAFVNRCSKKMYFIWSTIFGMKHLQCTIENWGIQRGTKDLQFIDPQTNTKILNYREQIKWRRNLRPHWDINPWTYCHNLQNGKWKYLYQGALALSEQRLCDGTHLNLPACIHFLNEWCNTNKTENINPFKHNINFKDNLIKYMQPIPLRKGEMVIWNFGNLHSNTKNQSNKMRLCQYMRMIPSEKKYIERDRRCAKQQLVKYKNEINIHKIMGQMDDKTQKLLGLKEW